MRPEDLLAGDSPGDERPPRGVRAHTWKGGFYTALQTADYDFVADEPDSAGGTNEGPTPYDLLAAALASCTTMTLHMYAERKGWPLEEARVDVTHEKIHAEDCAHCETEEGKIDRLHRTLVLAGPLSGDQRQRLLEIADRCPVHRTLHGEIDVQTRLADEDA